ncbi:MAG: methyl-accepting chemotaxis protein [Actinomycetaceae bacterium]|nr:methyl-accepting chemotaxis protein [Actinomycetaceae bacterium]
MNIATKFALISVIGILIGLLVLTTGIIGMNRYANVVEGIHRARQVTQQVGQLEVRLKGMGSSELRIAHQAKNLLGKDAVDPAKNPDYAELQAVKEELSAITSELGARQLRPENMQLVKEMNQEIDTYIALGTKVGDLIRQGTPESIEAALDLSVGEMLEEYDLAIKAADAVKEAMSNVATDAYSTGAKTAQVIMWIVGLMAIVGAAGAIIYLIGAVRRMNRSVQDLKNALDAMSHQDLTYRATVTSNDEISDMVEALTQAQEKLGNILQEAKNGAEFFERHAAQVQGSSNEALQVNLDSTAQAGVVAAAAEQVSRSVETVAAGAEQMGASIREIATNANEAARVAADAKKAAEATQDTVGKLGDSSKEIGEVIKSITAIAEQTNLLALNATIEAARAGEAGKGFAVVAGEVKDLAAETSKATDEISTKISAIQTDTDGAVQAINRIADIIGQINDYQTTIAAAVEEQTATTNEMSRSVQEAATGSAEIATNIGQYAEVASGATEPLEHLSQESGQLANTASHMRGTLSGFTV